jgi:hypothetical protein
MRDQLSLNMNCLEYNDIHYTKQETSTVANSGAHGKVAGSIPDKVIEIFS